jgi:glutathione synthase/RimK-type ligase-like ATP-grasp enzyme
VCVWDDPGVDWDSLSAVVVRSTWDYHRHRDAYIAWAERVASHLSFWNPLETLRWNSHKSYLSRMGADGIPVVPTETGRVGETLQELAARKGWSDVVVKPAVSAGAESTFHVRAGEYALAEESYRSALSTGEQFVQPYVTEIDEAGEHSLVYFNGVYSHAVRRPPGLVARQAGAPAATRLEPEAAEREVAERALRFAASTPLYARADLVPLRSGTPVLMELELIEPALFLGVDPGAPERFAQAILARVG